MPTELDRLRAKLSAFARNATHDPGCSQDSGGKIGLGPADLDRFLEGGLGRGALHEVFAAGPLDAGTATGFAAALTRRVLDSASAGKSGTDKAVVWVRQAFVTVEAGTLYAPGLAGLGLDPAHLVLVEAKDPLGVLKAGLEAARCAALGAVVIEPWGAPKVLDFTATRRLALAASEAGTTVFLLRLQAEPQQSAAETRWRVAAGPSRPLPANAPGAAAFTVELLRHRTGPAGRRWHLEWDHGQCLFTQPARRAPLPRPVVSLPQRGSHPAPLPAQQSRTGT
ncbi:ImuA family protein [Rhodobium gokarnense]|uniref:Protein ImuA n=1 Tax=Rhodobium gokarnense TaxID=364296 RepID=A0ABT3HFF6_9HYPH|nr:hypothetical protein [Rhodobium gokarnense]MCW2309074.1 protein ImuA [Rhodobium gokarnense]